MINAFENLESVLNIVNEDSEFLNECRGCRF